MPQIHTQTHTHRHTHRRTHTHTYTHIHTHAQHNSAHTRFQVVKAVEAIDSIDAGSMASLLVDLQRFLLLVMQDSPLVNGDAQSLVNAYVSVSFLVLCDIGILV